MESRTLAQPALSSPPDKLVMELRNCLLGASDVGTLSTTPRQIFSLLKHEIEEEAGGSQVLAVYGGASMDKGQATDEFFVRSDGARISFSVAAVYPRNAAAALRVYRFHLRYPNGANPRFIRIDLNRPGGGDALIEPRSHVHVGAEALRIPVPIMAPLEILEKVLYGLALPPRH